MGNQDFQNRIKTIVEERLVRVTPEVKAILPPVLQDEIEFFTFLTKSYFGLFFVDNAEKERIKKLQAMKIQPFPFLIKPEELQAGSAFKFEKAKFSWIEKCTVNNMFSLDLGKDSAIILSNHKQLVNTKELGTYEYSIKLGYVISFGEEINLDNLYTFLEDLIAYSLKTWAGSR